MGIWVDLFFVFGWFYFLEMLICLYFFNILERCLMIFFYIRGNVDIVF